MPPVFLSSQAMPAQIGGPLSEAEIAEDIRNMERAIQASSASTTAAAPSAAAAAAVSTASEDKEAAGTTTQNV